MAFCKIFSNIPDTVATTIQTKVVTIQMARKPPGSSSFLWDILMYRPAVTIKPLKMIAQNFIRLSVPVDFVENILFWPMHPSNLKALYNATKNAVDEAYTNKMNGSA